MIHDSFSFSYTIIEKSTTKNYTTHLSDAIVWVHDPYRWFKLSYWIYVIVNWNNIDLHRYIKIHKLVQNMAATLNE